MRGRSSKRGYWAFDPYTGKYGETDRPSLGADGLELEITSGFQGVTIAVTQEKAMDSYNETFTCSVTLSSDDAVRALRDWLTAALEA